MAALLFLFLALPAQADGLSAAEATALKQTQKLFMDPDRLLDAAKSNPGGEKALEELGKVAGSAENQQAIMELASSILETVVRKAKGDPAKMMSLLSDLQKDPNSLEKLLTPAQREKLTAIGKKIEAKGKLP